MKTVNINGFKKLEFVKQSIGGHEWITCYEKLLKCITNQTWTYKEISYFSKLSFQKNASTQFPKNISFRTHISA